MLAFTVLALVYLEGGTNRLDLARLVIDEGKQRDPGSAPLLTAEGVLLYRRGDTVHAMSAFQNAARDPFAAFDLGLVLLQLRRFDDAKRLLASPPSPAVAYDFQLALGVALRGTGKLADAERAYDKARQLDPTRPEAYFDLGLLHMHFLTNTTPELMLPEYNKAIELFKQVEDRSQGPLGAEAGRQIAACLQAITMLERMLAKP